MLILRLIQANQCQSELLQFLHKFYLLFCTGYIRGHLNLHGIVIKHLAFLYKIFNKSIHMDDNRLMSWNQSLD